MMQQSTQKQVEIANLNTLVYLGLNGRTAQHFDQTRLTWVWLLRTFKKGWF